MLTSSLRGDEHQRCSGYPYVKQCLAKPITTDLLKQCIND